MNFSTNFGFPSLLNQLQPPPVSADPQLCRHPRHRHADVIHHVRPATRAPGPGGRRRGGSDRGVPGPAAAGGEQEGHHGHPPPAGEPHQAVGVAGEDALLRDGEIELPSFFFGTALGGMGCAETECSFFCCFVSSFMYRKRRLCWSYCQGCATPRRWD